MVGKHVNCLPTIPAFKLLAHSVGVRFVWRHDLEKPAHQFHARDGALDYTQAISTAQGAVRFAAGSFPPDRLGDLGSRVASYRRLELLLTHPTRLRRGACLRKRPMDDLSWYTIHAPTMHQRGFGRRKKKR
jgi:hypothetical protein